MDSADGDDDNADFTDIGVGERTTPHGGSRRKVKRVEPGDRRSLSEFSVGRVAAIAVIVVVSIALVGGLFGTAEEQSRSGPRPTPTAAAEVSTPTPVARADPARPGPTPTVQVPVVSKGLFRAGEECRIEGDGLAGAWSIAFTVPDGRTLRDCSTGGFVLRDPRAKPSESIGTVYLTSRSLGAVLSSLRAVDDWKDSTTTWAPVDGRRAYRIERVASSQDATERAPAIDRKFVIDAAVGTIIVDQRVLASAPDHGESIDELVASIRVDGRQAFAPPLPRPGGWCAGDHYVAEVPPGWFAGEQCRWLNTSSESLTVLECECLPPLWIEHVRLPIDGDFGFARIDSDRYTTRADGKRLRIVEGLRRDPNNMDRPLRAMIVDGGVERVMVMSTEFPEHALPGHTWSDTLDAQQFMVEHLRFHSLPSCGDGRRLIAAVDAGPFVEIEVGTQALGLPSGSAVQATGCERPGPRGLQREVRVEARDAVVGWIDGDLLRSPETRVCQGAEFEPRGWDQEFGGDFDGDGRADQGFARQLVDAQTASSTAHDPLPTLALVLASGGVVTTSSGSGGEATVERFIGMGRDTVGVVSGQRPSMQWQLFEVSGCSIEEIFAGDDVSNDGERAGFCRAQSGLSEWLRVWREERDEHQGWVTTLDRRWGPTVSFGATDRALSARAGAKVCGPELAGPLKPVVSSPSAESIAGEHQLSLQWLSARARTTGRIALEPIDTDQYEATGSHVTAFGELVVVGVIERNGPDELAFEGRIESRVPWLNAGETCVRDAGQRFVRRPSTNTFRMQDRINCDGARTDWIDITFDAEPLNQGSN